MEEFTIESKSFGKVRVIETGSRVEFRSPYGVVAYFDKYTLAGKCPSLTDEKVFSSTREGLKYINRDVRMSNNISQMQIIKRMLGLSKKS
jgi:hypothetical protein